MNIATFPPASLQAQLDELRRERGMRGRVYPHMVSSGKLKQAFADHCNRALDGAIATLDRLVDAQARGEPGRAELVGALREAIRLADEGSAITDAIRDVLTKVPEAADGR